ncbi:MAG: glycosyltransferase [Thermodesulfobacteriota bacterium]
MPPLVSVILPAYNAAATLPAALDSLLAQSLADFEVVAVDDGSADATARVLAEYARRDRRVRPLSIPHGGIVAALDAALDAARGELLARMDADDLALPERLARQAAALEEDPELGLASCRVAFGGCRRSCAGYARYVDWTNSLLSPGDISLNRFVESPLAHPSVMFRAAVVREHGGYRDGPFPEDYELWLRWLEAGVRMRKLPETLLAWSDPPGRLSRVDGRYSSEAFYAVKAGYLARWLARRNPHHPDVVLAGAGRTTRKRMELLTGHGVRIAAYLDVDPRKIGHAVQGRPVLHRDQVPGPEECFVLSCVASHGAREDIAAFLEGRGFALGKNWLPAA